MRRIIFYLLLAAVLPCTQAYGQTTAAEVTMETIAFAEKDGRTLWLDKYETPGSEEARPVVLFAFGGGFYTGDRAPHDAQGARRQQGQDARRLP